MGGTLLDAHQRARVARGAEGARHGSLIGPEY